MSNRTPRVERSQKPAEGPEKNELRKKLLEMIKRKEMIRRGKPR